MSDVIPGDLDNIKAKTGKTPRQLKDLAAEAGVLKSDMKAGELVAQEGVRSGARALDGDLGCVQTERLGSRPARQVGDRCEVSRRAV